jgi:hypothetical protein
MCKRIDKTVTQDTKSKIKDWRSNNNKMRNKKIGSNWCCCLAFYALRSSNIFAAATLMRWRECECVRKRERDREREREREKGRKGEGARERERVSERESKEKRGK